MPFSKQADILHIYSIIRILIANDPATNYLYDKIPRELLHIFINDRLRETESQTNRIVEKCLSFKTKPKTQIPTSTTKKPLSFGQNLAEQAFSLAFVRLYDFITELDWHTDVEHIYETIKFEENFVHLNKWMKFKQLLETQLLATNSNKLSSKANKGLDSSASRLSLYNKRSVKFKDISPSSDKDSTNHKTNEFSGAAKDDQLVSRIELHRKLSISLLALDLTLYSLYSTVSQMYNCIKSHRASVSSKNLLSTLKNGQRKLTPMQHRYLASSLAESSDMYVTALQAIHLIKSTYLNDFLVQVVTATSPQNIIDKHKRPRFDFFIGQIDKNYETCIVQELTDHFIEIFINLTTDELNASAFDGQTKEAPNEFRDFLDSLFGLLSNKKPKQTKAQKSSSKSSSARLLEELEQLQTIVSRLFAEIVDKIESQHQAALFIGKCLVGFVKIFDALASQMEVATTELRDRRSSYKDNEYHFLSLNLKVRHLKIVYTFKSLNEMLLNGLDEKHFKRPTNQTELCSRVEQFADKIHKKMTA